MPDASRSAGTVGTTPDTGPAAVLTDFVALMADALIRQEPDALPKPLKATLDNRWLAALTGDDASLKADDRESASWQADRAVAPPGRRNDGQSGPAVLPAGGTATIVDLTDDEAEGENATAVVSPTGPWMVRYLLNLTMTPVCWCLPPTCGRAVGASWRG